MQLAADEDRDALVDFMYAHAPILMFPLYNLSRYGMGQNHPRSISVWITKDGDKVTDALTLSEEGFVFPCCPNADWNAAATVLAGRKIKGFLGDGAQVAAVRHAVSLTAKAALDVLEPSYVLNLADIAMPNVKGLSLRPLTAVDTDLVVGWRVAYAVETLATPPEQAYPQALEAIARFTADDSHRVLFDGDQPIAMTGFNAALPEIVQIGGVYTPPQLRNRGYARKALAMHLSEVSIDGVTQAVLSAANEAAARAYIALGFQRTGDFAFAIYDEAQVAHG